MKTIYEKEKKLNLALNKLNDLNLENPSLKKGLENLNNQKNQLEIEKADLENKYKALLDDHANLTKKLEEIQSKELTDERKQIEFSEKIDELNQETDNLLEEIDKWQM